MNRTIDVRVKDKIAVQTNDTIYICGNSDFIINFDFDDEWAEYDFKTARFAYGNSFTDVLFEGNQCAVPVISNVYNFNVGVYTGELKTSTPAFVSAKKSILCGGGMPVEPTPDVYSQMMELFAAGIKEASQSEQNAKRYAEEAKTTAENAAPMVETTDIFGGTNVKITDVNGDNSFDVMNGLSIYTSRQNADMDVVGGYYSITYADVDFNGQTPRTGDLVLTANGEICRITNPNGQNGDLVVIYVADMKGKDGVDGDNGADGLSIYYWDCNGAIQTVGNTYAIAKDSIIPQGRTPVSGDLILTSSSCLLQVTGNWSEDKVATVCVSTRISNSIFASYQTTTMEKVGGWYSLIYADVVLDYGSIAWGDLVITASGQLCVVASLPNQEDGDFGVRFIADLKSKTNATEMHLASPNGTEFKITVDDNGVLTTVKVT